MSTLPEYFGAAYLINLPERVDRLASAKIELGRLKWPIGTDGINLFPARRFAERGGFPNAGVRGAFYSHWECLQQAHTKGDFGALILEDDISFSSHIPKLTPLIISKLEANNWDIVFFGHYNTGEIPNANSKAEPKEFEFIECFGEIHGLHFYGVNSRILGRLNEHLERVASGREGDQVTGPMPVDGALNTFRRLNPDVRTFIANPKLGWQKPSRSDITPAKLDRLPAIRPLMSAFHRIKQIVDPWRS